MFASPLHDLDRRGHRMGLHREEGVAQRPLKMRYASFLGHGAISSSQLLLATVLQIGKSVHDRSTLLKREWG